MKIVTVTIVMLVGIIVTGCAAFADNGGVSVSGQVSYEYQKSL
jgi:hypothetical protein